MASKTNLLAIWCGILIFAGAGGFCFLFGARELLDGYRSKSWPSVSGEVVSAELTTSTGTSSGSKATYSAVVLYRYQIDGHSYESARIRFGATGGSRGTAQGFLNRYPAGSEVEVFHRPGRPEDSVLESGWTKRSLVFLLVGLPLCGMAYLFYRLRIYV
jgi:hypothetical protein